MKLLVCGEGEIDCAVLEKFDHLSLYYIYHFLFKKLRKEKFDGQMKFKPENVLREKIRLLTLEYVGQS